MKTASQILLHEHNAILVALGVIEKMCKHAKNHHGVDPKDIIDIVDFLDVYVNECHHTKEEVFFFPALVKVGVRNQDGLIGSMIAEHRLERELIVRIRGSIVNDVVDKEEFVGAASAYIELIRTHIVKENSVLFQISDIKFTEATHRRLVNEFESIEKNRLGVGVTENAIAMLKEIKKKY
ncbi:hemerythrin domain-containing protein [uncultured Acetobacteroides sp.]|uniref:hemerythrin domain-containing protein n=1 Tax=uncultured Acetobacteroides sp. TaxID=1760811 RepID=UPI0029F4A092|nr:hemerythrin domain-containing protein [uncultured Acetobacteroides sp.]